MNEDQQKKLLKAKEIAKNRGGSCLSEEYITGLTKMKWVCEQNHTWESTYKNVVKRDSWCSKCSNKKSGDKRKNKNGLLEAQEHAKIKGGKCLSQEYIGASKKLEWICAKSHTWIASYASVIKGSWCRKCGSEKTSEKNTNKNGLLHAQQHAEKNGGKCLSIEYISSLNKLDWRCAENHVWKASYNNVVNRNRWCNKCSIKKNSDRLRNKNGLLEAQEHAKNKGGECLSTEYIGSQSKLEWKCANNHTWQASYSSVIRGSWCPNCSYYYYKEHKIRDLLEYFLSEKFPKVRPQWNVNPKTNRVLELDGYSEKLRIAFEFQGEHHYKSGVFKDGDLEYIKYKDEIKRKNCASNGVMLIVIDDKFKLTQQKEIVDNIIKVLSEKKIKIKTDIKQDEIDNIFIKTINQQKIFLAKAKEHAESKDGYCLSEQYVDATTKLKWECAENHIWEALYYSIVGANQWCPQCGQKRGAEKQRNKNGLEIAKKYALEKGGQCLSTEYIDNRSKMKWECVKNHIWENSYNGVVTRGAWCLKCAKEKVGDNRRNKKGLDLAKKYALEKGGQCLSTEYFNNGTKMKWKCSKNHIWESSYRNVVTGKAWCWDCYNIKRGRKLK